MDILHTKEILTTVSYEGFITLYLQGSLTFPLLLST